MGGCWEVDGRMLGGRWEAWEVDGRLTNVSQVWEVNGRTTENSIFVNANVIYILGGRWEVGGR